MSKDGWDSRCMEWLDSLTPRDFTWVSTIFAEQADTVSFTATVPVAVVVGNGESTETSVELTVDDLCLDGNTFLSARLSLLTILAGELAAGADPRRLAADLLDTALDFARKTGAVKGFSVVQRICVECDHLYVGDLVCPACQRVADLAKAAGGTPGVIGVGEPLRGGYQEWSATMVAEPGWVEEKA